MTSAKGVFIGQRKDRMGARLLMMLTCIRLAEDFDTTFKVNWFPQGADAPELDQPGELFTRDWMDAHFLRAKAFEKLTEKALPIWTFQGDKSPDRLIAHLDSGKSILVEEGFEVLAFPWEDIETISPRYRDFIHRIGFTDEIRAIMDRADEKLSGQGVSAYHIRRGDILNGLPWKHTTWPAKIEPEELYEAHLEKTAGQTAIMFSDQPELITRFQKRFPKLLQMSDIADVSGMTRAQRDFLELYTMSRAEQVIAPVISAFSMAAARVSGQERLLFRHMLDDEERARANELTISRLRNGSAEFLSVSEAAHIYSKVLFHLYALNSGDRAQEAFELGAGLLDAGADNAFMPRLQALNLLYLGRWAEALELVELALEDPNVWPEDYAALCALRCALLGQSNKRWRAAQSFSQAIWAKPLRPDVVVLCSRALYRDQLALRALPPTDWALQKSIRRPWYSFNSYIAQRRVITRIPCNFDMLLLDWWDLALDQKARRLINNPARLETLIWGLNRQTNIDENDPSVVGFSALLQLHMGQIPRSKAIEITRTVSRQRPENPLYHKRLADLYEAEGDQSQARLTMAEALACDPDNAFLVFAMGRFLERIGAQEQGETQILRAADLDSTTASIQGMAGQIYLRRGDKGKARNYLQKAHELYPAYKRFGNQLKRAGG
ncbi:putative PEP-CTERM system TPR-repeat lipoprotein [Ruegeria denitrificans]|uniref:Putative PEP-CTERM system TPR-repeat lipoprotein n=1 Tax=Ruegeria denitrificans TaxID=1715692 RepID=A0A0P1I623_9RHOB|nr:hypothetical protein [Ruegeria denitrificans]CUJ92153.1 putative PEP-CTERM system TPR-repeat lipoprotein [Ruegeria denitrificans]